MGKTLKKSGRTVPTYKELNSRSFSIGKELYKKLQKGRRFNVGQKPVRALDPLPRHNDKAATRLIHEAIDPKKSISERSFSRRYRFIYARTDEFVSTSTIKSILSGIRESAEESNTSLTRKNQDLLTRGLINVSKMRAPTQHVGHNYEDVVMLHPTSKKLQIFEGEQKGDPARAHNELDRARANEVIRSLEKGLKRNDVNVSELLSNAAVTGTAFTLNNMAAPATAKNQKTISTKSSSSLTKATEGRDYIKIRGEKLGGNLARNPQKLNNEWRSQFGEEARGRSLSRSRLKRKRNEFSPLRSKHL